MRTKQLNKLLLHANCWDGSADKGNGNDRGGGNSFGADGSTGDYGQEGGGFNHGSDTTGSGRGNYGGNGVGLGSDSPGHELSDVQSAIHEMGVSFGWDGFGNPNAYTKAIAGGFALGDAEIGNNIAKASIFESNPLARYNLGLTQGKYGAEVATSSVAQAIAHALTGAETSHEFSDNGNIGPTGKAANVDATSVGAETRASLNDSISKGRGILGRAWDSIFGINRAISAETFNKGVYSGNVGMGPLGENAEGMGDMRAVAMGMAKTNAQGELVKDPWGVAVAAVSPIASMIGFGPQGLTVSPNASTLSSIFGSAQAFKALQEVSGLLSDQPTTRALTSAEAAATGQDSGGDSGGRDSDGTHGTSNPMPSYSPMLMSISEPNNKDFDNQSEDEEDLPSSTPFDKTVRFKKPTSSLTKKLGKFGQDFDTMKLAALLGG